MLFRTAFNRGSERYFASAGSRIRDKNSIVADESGNKIPQKVGETDFYSFIQSFKDSVDLKSIIERCALSGDLALLDRKQTTFGDYVGFPSDLRSIEDLRINTESVYNSLPDDVRTKYSLIEFLECFSDQEKFNILNDLINPSAKEKDGDPIES